MSRVVGRVVDRLDRRKAGDADEHDPEQDRGNTKAHRVALRVWNGGRLDQGRHFILLRPPPEDMSAAQKWPMSPAGLLTRGSAPCPDLPGACSSGLSRGLAAYSCGGSRGFEQ